MVVAAAAAGGGVVVGVVVPAAAMALKNPQSGRCNAFARAMQSHLVLQNHSDDVIMTSRDPWQPMSALARADSQ